MGHGGELFQRLQHARRRLGVDDGDELDLAHAIQHGLDRLGVEGPAPCPFGADDVAPVALHHIPDALAEEAVHPNDHVVPGLDDVAHRRLHARRPRARHRDRRVVLGAEHLPQHRADLFHDLHEPRVEVPDHRRAQRLQHPRVDVGGSGPQQGSFRRIEQAGSALRHSRASGRMTWTRERIRRDACKPSSPQIRRSSGRPA